MTFIKTGFFFIFCFFLCPKTYSQSTSSDTINYKGLYGLAVRGEVQSALEYLDTVQPVNPEDKKFKTEFLDRFKYEKDRTDYFSKTDTVLNPLHRIFRKYWRKGLLDQDVDYDSIFKQELLVFFHEENTKQKVSDHPVSEKNLPQIYKTYIESKGYNTTDFGKTGKFYDFLVWKTMQLKTYSITLIDDTVDVDVYFMSDFLSLGWLAYARLGNYYPGGWATEQALYCVTKGYDTSSEKFAVNYLKHEGQHFSDYKNFPDLPPYLLEYRGKLMEMYFGKEELYHRIEYFINNAKYDERNAHPHANYHIVKKMSEVLFQKEFEKDIQQWKKVPVEKIHAEAKKLYLENTEKLKAGKTEI